MSGNSSLQPPHDLADAEQRSRRSGVLGRGRHSMKVSRYLPICSSSPFSRPRVSMRRRLTKVPFSEPWSSTAKRPSRSTSTAWLRETVTSSRKISQSGERPIRVRGPGGAEALPRAAAARSGRRAPGPRGPRPGSCSSSPTSSARSVCVVSTASRPVCEQRAAARAVVRGLRDSGSRTPGSRRGSRRPRRRLGAHAGGAALPARISRQPVDVDLVEHALPPGLLQPRDELGAEDVDLAVQQAALVADLPLLLLEVADQLLARRRTVSRDREGVPRYRLSSRRGTADA